MIDLRREFNKLLKTEGGKGIGRWVLLRHYTDEYTEYWNEAYKEAVNGPKFKYVDTLYRSFSNPTGYGMSLTGDGSTRVEPADIPTEGNIFYFESDVKIDKNDIIFDLGWRREELPIVVYDKKDENISEGKVAPKKKSEVLKVVPFSSDTAGAVEFQKVYAEEHGL